MVAIMIERTVLEIECHIAESIMGSGMTELSSRRWVIVSE